MIVNRPMYKQTSDVDSHDLATYLFALNCSAQSSYGCCDITVGDDSTHQRSSSHERDRSLASLPSPSLPGSSSRHYPVPSANESEPLAPSNERPPTTLHLLLYLPLVSAYLLGESSLALPRSGPSSASLPRHIRERSPGPLFSFVSAEFGTEERESPHRRRPSTASARTCIAHTHLEGTTCDAAASATAGRE